MNFAFWIVFAVIVGAALGSVVLRDIVHCALALMVCFLGVAGYYVLMQAEFLAGVTSALDHVRTRHEGNVLLVSSGGPISTAVGHVLGTSPDTTIELNLRIRNSALTEFAFTPKRHMLLSYNHLPHLDSVERRLWETYS